MPISRKAAKSAKVKDDLISDFATARSATAILVFFKRFARLSVLARKKFDENCINAKSRLWRLPEIAILHPNSR